MLFTESLLPANPFVELPDGPKMKSMFPVPWVKLILAILLIEDVLVE